MEVIVIICTAGEIVSKEVYYKREVYIFVPGHQLFIEVILLNVVAGDATLNIDFIHVVKLLSHHQMVS